MTTNKLKKVHRSEPFLRFNSDDKVWRAIK